MYSCVVVDRRSLAKTINSRGHDVPKRVVDVKVYLAERKLDVCDEQVEHGGMFWPQTMKVSQSEMKRIYAIHPLAVTFVSFLSFLIVRRCTFPSACTPARERARSPAGADWRNVHFFHSSALLDRDERIHPRSIHDKNF